MIVILNNKTHVGTNPPSDTTKTWISADMTEISIYPEPETYGRLNERIDVKPILLAHNLDIKSNRIRIFSLADDVLEVKRYINGEWIVIDNPDNYVDIIMNGKVIGTMEVDSIAPGEQVEEWNGTGVIIEEIKTEEIPDELAGTWLVSSGWSCPAGYGFWTFNGYTQKVGASNTWSTSSGIFFGYEETLEFIGTTKENAILVGYDIYGHLYPQDSFYLVIEEEPEDNNGKLSTWLKANATKQVDTNEDGGSGE